VPQTPATDGEPQPNPEHGLPLCLWCRERVSAVRAFYSFLRSIAPLISGRSGDELELFRRTVACRQQMAVARVGCIYAPVGQSSMEEVASPTAWSPWLGEGWENRARLVK